MFNRHCAVDDKNKLHGRCMHDDKSTNAMGVAASLRVAHAGGGGGMSFPHHDLTEPSSKINIQSSLTSLRDPHEDLAGSGGEGAVQ
jgi:hypothetical protein